MDYKQLSSSYWQRADHFGLSSFRDARPLVEEILAVAGYARMLDVGCGKGELVLELLGRGIECQGVDAAPLAVAHGNGLAPGRFREGSVLNLPFEEDAFPVVLSTALLDHLHEKDIDGALRELWRVCGGTLWVKVATMGQPDRQWRFTVKPREWWEERMLTAGFRKHPLAQSVISYEALESEGDVATIIMEKIPPDVLACSSLDTLSEERDLHMDMTREVGRRSDAHIARYVLAGRYVRPGDTVLDVACGLGYGSHILARSTGAARVIGSDSSSFAITYADKNFARDGDRVSFRAEDAHNLSWLPENSVDFVVSMETLEHLREPGAFLAEIRRVLRPSGRIIVSVPNQWVDETGHDPNPHHLHVYDLIKLRNHLSLEFDLELLWSQTAGGGIKHPHAPRRIVELPMNGGDPSAAEWLLALGMKSPLKGTAVALCDNAFPQADRAGGNVVAFGKWYQNPWLVRSLVTRGSRAHEPLLNVYASYTVATADADSADLGAALCVSAYHLLEERRSANFLTAAVALERDLQEYLLVVSQNPHVNRWRISCAYALGLLCRATGDLESAEKAFLDCIRQDPLVFSPLIGTKTLSAHAELAKMYLVRNDIPAARRTLEDALVRATQLIGADWANVIGLTTDPYAFGFHELSELADIASRCALSLESLNRGWSPEFGFARTRITHSETITNLQYVNRQVLGDLNGLRTELANNRNQLEKRDSELALLACEHRSKTQEVKALQADAGDLRRQVAELSELRLRDEQVRREMEQAAFTKARQYSLYLTQLDASRSELEAKGKEIELLQARAVDLDASRRELEAKAKEIELLQARALDTESILAKREGQVARFTTETAQRDKRLSDLDERLRESDRARAEIEQSLAFKERQYLYRLHETERQNDFWKSRADALVGSTSWKLTTPLRVIAEGTRLLILQPRALPARFRYTGRLYRAKGTRATAIWLWRRLGGGRISAQEVTALVPDVAETTTGRPLQRPRLATLRWGMRRFSEITRARGVRSSVRAVVAYVERRKQRRGVLPGPAIELSKREEIALAEPPPYLGCDRVRGALQSEAALVGMLVDSFNDGGLERVTLDLCLSLRRKGYAPVILIATSGGRSADEARQHRLAVVELNSSPDRLAVWLRAERPVLVVTHHCYFELQQFKAANVPVVEVLHNAYFWQVGNSYVEKQRSNVDEMVAVSEFVRTYAISSLNLPPNSITTIPNGLNIHGLVRPPLVLMNERRLQTLHNPVLAFVANLHPQKNHRGVIQAFSRVLREFPGARLKIAGTLEGNESLREQIDADVRTLDLHRTVEFLGPLDRRSLSRLLAEAHVGLLPTRFEGFSIATLEYAFYGLPSVLSDTGASRWLSKEYGHVLLADGCALLPEQLDAEAIEECINGRYLSGSREIAEAVLAQLKDYPTWLQRSKGAAERFASYSIEAGADRYATLIERVAARGRRP